LVGKYFTISAKLLMITSKKQKRRLENIAIHQAVFMSVVEVNQEEGKPTSATSANRPHSTQVIVNLMPFPIILQQEPQTGVARAARPSKVISISIQQQMPNGPGIANLFARLMSPIRQ
jgi:hypothetical protein